MQLFFERLSALTWRQWRDVMLSWGDHDDIFNDKVTG
jgi:hypothetical protein